MKTIYLILIPLVVLLFLNSCTTTMYTTNAVNVPLLKEKGEVKINATQNDLQAAVAVSDDIGIIANGFYKNYEGANNYKHNGGLVEVGVGYLLNSEANLVMETYVGGGLGIVEKRQQFVNNDNSTYMANFSVNANKMFLQTNLGYRSKYFDVALTPKFSFVKYSNFNSTNYSDNQLSEDYLENKRIENPLFVFAEPAITIRGGYKFVKLQAQYGVTLNLGGQSIRRTPDFGSIGLVFDIAGWYRN